MLIHCAPANRLFREIRRCLSSQNEAWPNIPRRGKCFVHSNGLDWPLGAIGPMGFFGNIPHPIPIRFHFMNWSEEIEKVEFTLNDGGGRFGWHGRRGGGKRGRGARVQRHLTGPAATGTTKENRPKNFTNVSLKRSERESQIRRREPEAEYYHHYYYYSLLFLGGGGGGGGGGKVIHLLWRRDLWRRKKEEDCVPFAAGESPGMGNGWRHKAAAAA